MIFIDINLLIKNSEIFLFSYFNFIRSQLIVIYQKYTQGIAEPNKTFPDKGIFEQKG